MNVVIIRKMNYLFFKKGNAYALVFCLLLFYIIIPFAGGEEGDITLVTVDDDYDVTTDGWGIDHFNNIQDGINAVSEGGTVFVRAGTYEESIIIDKSISLNGQTRDMTTIQYEQNHHIIQITADDVEVSGFTIQHVTYNVGESYAGIYIESNQNIINNNYIFENRRGIFLNNSNSNSITYNIFIDNDIGIITFNSNYNIISNNEMSGSQTIYNINLYDSSNNIITDNFLEYSMTGIIFYNSNNNLVTGNFIRKCSYGIFFTSIYPSLDNYIYHNNLYLNTENVRDYGELTTHWDNGYPDGGNYYDDYTGEDANNDGFGDTPYDILPGYTKDSYPYVNVLGWTTPRLEIETIDNVNENEPFLVTITANDEPVFSASVTFAGSVYLTDAQGKATLTAPDVSSDQNFTITVSKDGYSQVETIILILDSEDITEHLMISAPSSINEGELIQIIITSDSTPVMNAEVNFATMTDYTDQNGHTSFIAPQVDLSTIYYITASKPGYISSFVTMQVINIDEDESGDNDSSGNEPDIPDPPLDEPDDEEPSDDSSDSETEIPQIGWITGLITHESEEIMLPLQGVTVCVILSNENNIITSKCALTDSYGSYQIPILMGSYSLTAGKQGFITKQKESIQVNGDQTTQVNFVLETGMVETDTTGFLPILLKETRESINYAIDKGDVGADIIIKQEEGDLYNSAVVTYDELNINMKTISKNKIALIVNGDEDLTGKTIVITPDYFTIHSQFSIEYDGIIISEADDLADALDPKNDGSHPEYILTPRGEIIVSIPHFSEHEITIHFIEETVEFLTGPLAIMWYILLIIVGAIGLAVHLRSIWIR